MRFAPIFHYLLIGTDKVHRPLIFMTRRQVEREFPISDFPLFGRNSCNKCNSCHNLRSGVLQWMSCRGSLKLTQRGLAAQGGKNTSQLENDYLPENTEDMDAAAWLFEEIYDPYNNPGQIVEIRPIQVSSSNGTPVASNNTPHPILHQFAKGIRPPILNNTFENWPEFNWEFGQYLERMECIGGKIDDKIKLLLLENSLPDALLRELELLRKIKGAQPSFESVMTMWNDRFGKFKILHMRKKGEEVSLPKSGKIGTAKWGEFEVEFQACILDVRDATNGKSRRLLFSKLRRIF